MNHIFFVFIGSQGKKIKNKIIKDKTNILNLIQNKLCYCVDLYFKINVVEM